MQTAIAFFIALVVGFVLGLLFAPRVRVALQAELSKVYSALTGFILNELKKIHAKLDAIFAAVKK